MTKDFVELSKEWFDNQAKTYDENNTILYSKYGKISCKNIYNYLKEKEFKKLLDLISYGNLQNIKFTRNHTLCRDGQDCDFKFEGIK